MVEFGGFSMPVQYEDQTIAESHNWTRTKASLFDVSHMYALSGSLKRFWLIIWNRFQHEITGTGASAFLSRLTPASPGAIETFHSTYSCFLHPTGGIIDDSIIANISEEDPKFYFVTNGATRDKVSLHLRSEVDKWNDEASEDVTHTAKPGNGLLALQGPLAAGILQALDPADVNTGQHFDLQKLLFGQCAWMRIAMIGRVLVSRGGYTGEDGFEISVPPGRTDTSNRTLNLTKLLMDTAGKDNLRLAGLGARDSLRLEAAMCLYGHDIDDTTTPVEAALSWIIAKDRRADGGFYGSDTILQQLKKKSEGGGVSRRRVGLIVEDKAAAREGAEIVDEKGEKIGVVTSGAPSPTLGKNIAMGYVKDGMHKSGTEVGVIVRKKTRKAVVTKMPFVQPKYWKGPASA